MTKPVELVTFGCRLNINESALMEQLALEAGLDNVVIVNTCAVTHAAEKDARRAIRRLRRERPDVQIVVTGCDAQINPTSFSDMPEVNRVLGNADKLKLESYLPEAARVVVNEITMIEETAAHLTPAFEGRTRAFVQVQNGCDHRCTFCIIPYGRGPSRSVAIGAIVDQVRALVEQGYQEVVLTGVDVTSYGHDLPGKPTLGQMVRRLLTLVPELPRLRLSSLDPVEVDEDLFQLLAGEPRFMPHLHISLQAGDDLILKRMKRRHLSQDVRDFCARVRALRPDAVFGADVIAGFPTEDDERFDNTRQLLKECGITYYHVFPFSPRPGTPAARMPQVNPQVVKARAALLREDGEEALAQYLSSCVGQTAAVLFERDGFGRTAHFARVSMENPPKEGTLCTIKIVGATRTYLEGVLK